MSNQDGIFFLKLLMVIIGFQPAQAETAGILEIDLANGKTVTPIEYGFHYEEIGMIGEGGLHAEMVRNRSLEEANMPRGLAVKDNRYVGIPGRPEGRKAVYQKDPLIGWAQPAGSGGVRISRTREHPMNANNPHSLLVVADGQPGPASLHNTGFLGMSFIEGKTYRFSFYARNTSFNGGLSIVLADKEGNSLSGELTVHTLQRDWTGYTHTFTARRTTTDGILRLTPEGDGVFQLDMVSLYPGETWDNGKSIFRRDIIRNLADYKPDFVRFPGGCIVHGCSGGTIYYWKETVGPVEQRPGAWSKWPPHYRTDGFGYHEFLQLCEYLDSDAMFVVPTGMICTGWVPLGEDGNHIHPEVDVEEFISNALDAIEYAVGPVDSEWGARRAANGHPEPFPLKYIELGNEDFGPTYWDRHDRFFSAIRSRYPQIRIITNSRIFKDFDDKRSELPNFKNPGIIEIFDEHYYKDMKWVFDSFNKFDRYDRPSPDLFIGELGIDGRYPHSLLGEGIINLYLERNADLNPLVADRPLGRNWDYTEQDGPSPVMLFHTSSQSFKTFNFHLSKLFRDNKIDRYFPSRWMPDNETTTVGWEYLFSSVGYDSSTECYVIKLINLQDDPVEFSLQIGDLNKVLDLQAILLTARPDQFASPAQPDAVQPRLVPFTIQKDGSCRVGARSLTILRIPEGMLSGALK